MPQERPFPTLEAVRRLLSQLLASGATTVEKSASPVVPGPKAPAVVALYAADNGALVGAWVSDIAFAAWAAAALTQFLGGEAQDCINRGCLDGALAENFSEIMNVGAVLFNGSNVAHSKLLSVQQVPAEKLPAAGQPLLHKTTRRLDLEIAIPRYGTGRVSLVVA